MASETMTAAENGLAKTVGSRKLWGGGHPDKHTSCSCTVMEGCFHSFMVVKKP